MEVAMQNRQSGITLVEIIITLTILMVLIGVGIPGLKQTLDRVSGDTLMQDIMTAVALAKQTAILENRMVTFCRSDDGFSCRGKWHEGSIVFTDANADHVLNGDDRLVYRFPPSPVSGSLTFNSFGNRQYLQITPMGFTNNQNGNFTFCPADKNPGQARQVIINPAARTRLGQDNDGDGIVEDSKGKPLSCE
jgi:type IV fimbrial biogenesis protein FimT